MKIKTDFVTNSSTSSFVVMGICMEKYEIPGYDEEQEEWEIMEEKTKGNDLEFAIMEYDDDVMIGIPYTSMGEDETLGQFRARVQQQIGDAFGIEQKPGHIEEAWDNH